MKHSQVKLFLIFALLPALWWGCKKDKDQVKLPPPVLNSPELITSLVLRFTDSAHATTAEFRDPDGPGGNPATRFDTIRLASHRAYTVTLLVLDETKNPADTISDEIWEERNDHQFFFSHRGTGITTDYLDADANGYPVGLTTKWQSGGPGNGDCQVVLKHQAGIKNGTQGPGETDVDVTFQVKVQ